MGPRRPEVGPIDARWTTSVTGALAVMSAIVLYASYERLVTTFVERELLLAPAALGWMLAYAVLSGALPSMAVALQGLARVRPLALAAIVNAAIVCSCGAAYAWAWGTAGMPAAMALSVATTTLFPLNAALRDVLSRTEPVPAAPPHRP